ncbi:PPOX class F420-dependent oxidoreductase [Amycolatopsis palatopharyngis]|uniref:PPOX class F420-dependent oxidoreductase n=1 Tax=Amycolatopsis palatopharyngis TaxID=187982 RepID=UPI000E2388C8|nr:PPOX class F420-dependent oxidoreductase [Amycolatopsis palatopharyngis]
MSTELDRLASEQYVVLTTFRKTGEPVPTPIWAARSGDELVVWTERESGKVKRIRRDGRVELTACDIRGKKTHGETVTGQARVLDDAESEQVRRAIAGKYGIIGRITMFFSKLRGGKERTIGIAIKLAS